jgi:hypothetical protein
VRLPLVPLLEAHAPTVRQALASAGVAV